MSGFFANVRHLQHETLSRLGGVIARELLRRLDAGMPVAIDGGLGALLGAALELAAKPDDPAARGYLREALDALRPIGMEDHHGTPTNTRGAGAAPRPGAIPPRRG